MRTSPADRGAPAGSGDPLDVAFFERAAPDVARDLIGCSLTCGEAGGVIVETEAYDQDDPASHSFRSPNGRAAVMFGPPGFLYVYRSYGIHWCMNLVCGREGHGAAVLLRALAPTVGRELMARRRGGGNRPLAAGPGRLTQALGIDGSFNARPALGSNAVLRLTTRVSQPSIVAGPRIGISVARDVLWRFGDRSSAYLSRPFPSEKNE